MTRAMIATVTALALTALAIPRAEAAPPPRVSGSVCSVLARSTPASGIWWAAFSGARSGFFDQRDVTYEVRCFTDLADCKAWLYWMQSDWPAENLLNRCARGLPP